MHLPNCLYSCKSQTWTLIGVKQSFVIIGDDWRERSGGSRRKDEENSPCSEDWTSGHAVSDGLELMWCPRASQCYSSWKGANALLLELLTRWLVGEAEVWEKPFGFEIICFILLPGGVLLPGGMSGSDGGGGHAHPSGAGEGGAGKVPAV